MFGIGSTGSLNFPMSYDYGNDYGQTSGEGRKGWTWRERVLSALLLILVLAAAGLVAAVVILALQLSNGICIIHRF
jgi:hypothetical protein